MISARFLSQQSWQRDKMEKCKFTKNTISYFPDGSSLIHSFEYDRLTGFLKLEILVNNVMQFWLEFLDVFTGKEIVSIFEKMNVIFSAKPVK